MSTVAREKATPIDWASVVRTRWADLLAWLMFVLFWVPGFIYFYKAWTNPDQYYTHGFLIPFMSAYTAWLKRKKASDVEVRPSSWAFTLVILTLLAATFFGLQNSQTLRGLAFPISLAWVVAAMYGWSVVKEFAFPIFYLYLLCAMPGFVLITVAFRVQLWSTTVACWLSKLMLIDATQQGTSISTSAVNVEVGAPCSGFRMLVALTAFAVFLVYMLKGSLRRKALFVLISMPFAIVLNALRVALLVAVGHYGDPTWVPVLHDYSGYLVLIIAFPLMYGIARLMGCREFRVME